MHDPQDPSPRTADGRRWLTLTMLGVVAVGCYGPSAMPVLADALERQFGLTKGQLGAVLPAFMAGGIAGALLGGWLSDRRSRVGVFAAFTAAGAAGYGLCSVGSGPGWLVAGLAVAGFGYGGATGAAAGLLSALYPRRRRGSFSALLVTNAAAGMAFPVIVTALLGAQARGALPFAVLLRVPFAVVGGALLVLAGAVWIGSGKTGAHACRGGALSPAETEERGPCSAAPPGSSEAVAPVAVGTVALIVLLATVHGTADSVLYSWMPKYLTDAFTRRTFAPGLVVTFYNGAYLAGRLGLTFLPDRFGRRALLVLPGLVAGPLSLLAVHAPGYTLAAVAYVAGAALYGLEYPALMGLAAQRFPRRFATIYGLANAAALATVAAVWGVGRWAEVVGSMRPGLSVAACGFILFSLLAGAWVVWDQRRPTS